MDVWRARGIYGSYHSKRVVYVMTVRHSIFDKLDNAPVPSANSWPARRPPSIAREAAYTALEAQAPRTARDRIKASARAYALRPRELDAICPGLSRIPPEFLVTALESFSKSFNTMSHRYFGFGGEITSINLRGAYLYARYSRAKAHQIARKSQ